MMKLENKSSEIEQQKTEWDKHEESLLMKINLLINPIKESLTVIKQEWADHKEEISRLQRENLMLNQTVSKMERDHRSLKHQIEQLENANLEHNVILQGIQEGPWETNDVCQEKVCQFLSNLVNKDTYEERI